jgi:hypothetical protein
MTRTNTKRTCQELGVCQSVTAICPCGDIPNVARSFTPAPAAPTPWPAEETSSWDRIHYGLVLIVACGLSAFTVIGGAVYLYSKHFGG